MIGRSRAGLLVALILCAAAPVSAADPNRDFSGKWTLDPSASRVDSLGMEIPPVLTVVQEPDSIRCCGQANFALDGSETRYQAGAETHRTAVKWEGSALLINTPGSQGCKTTPSWTAGNSDNHPR